ncbi:hypothetical protein C8F01DRAFT_1139133 [Mycena amicta]|nr:hypothetical protein C8F01DRAFT_1139133 [Mycena amicta]
MDPKRTSTSGASAASFENLGQVPGVVMTSILLLAFFPARGMYVSVVSVSLCRLRNATVACGVIPGAQTDNVCSSGRTSAGSNRIESHVYAWKSTSRKRVVIVALSMTRSVQGRAGFGVRYPDATASGSGAIGGAKGSPGPNG